MPEFNEKTVESLSLALPSEVLEFLKSTDNISTIFPVNNGERFSQQVLKADEIVFQQSASITFTSNNFPFYIIYARKWKFVDTSFRILIEIDKSIQAKDGEKGNNGVNGQNGVGEINRRGVDGNYGTNGENGQNGESLKNPALYIIAEEFICINPDQLPKNIKFLFDLDGIDGGDGGQGGNGGNGGDGASGKQGATGAKFLFDIQCLEGPGDGGTGGNSGAGGRGGNAGNGSDSSSIFLIGKKQVTDTLTNSIFYIEGGRAGRAGRSGKPGKPGRGGNGGPQNLPCGRGDRGAYGSDPNPLDFGDGIEANDGQKIIPVKIEVSKFE